MLFLRHPAWLWLKKYDPEKLAAAGEAKQAAMEEGNRFEAYANQLFPGAVFMGYDSSGLSPHDYVSVLPRTRDALAQQPAAILQGRVEVNGMTCIFDVLERTAENEYDLIEIKASTRVKPQHLYDLAFQLTVLEKASLTIRSMYVIHVNRDYVRQGEIDPSQLTARTEVTAEVRALMPKTDQLINEAFAVLNNPEIPDISPRFVNQHGIPGLDCVKEWLPVFSSLIPPQDTYSIYHLCSLSTHQLGQLEDRQIHLIADIPDELAANSRQLAQIIATRRNERVIKPEPIREFLESLSYPLYFFDYETFSSVIPLFDGCRPYQDYPFQYSLHVLDSPGSALRHREFLATESGNPLPALLAQLCADIGESGTVLAWNMRYEQQCNSLMGQLYPEYASFLTALNERMRDLMDPFARGWYIDKDFCGSASVKKVLPVLAPELSYKDLAIGEGLLARRLWMQTVLEGQHPEARDTILTNLRTYCGLDTYGMVRIWEELGKI